MNFAFIVLTKSRKREVAIIYLLSPVNAKIISSISSIRIDIGTLTAPQNITASSKEATKFCLCYKNTYYGLKTNIINPPKMINEIEALNRMRNILPSTFSKQSYCQTAQQMIKYPDIYSC